MDLHLRVKPRSHANTITLQADGSLMVRIKAMPVDGKANEAVIKLLSEHLKLPASAFEIKRGHTSRFKVITINAEEEYVRSRMDQLPLK